jgi:bifunctional non-homologous end joining protein LigD
MPRFVAPELCRLVDAPPAGANWVHEVKFDGYRMQLRVEKGRAVLSTRKALDWTARFPEIAAEAKTLPDCLIDGEICALKDDVPDFAALQNALSEDETGVLIFFAFDLLFLEGADLREQSLTARKEVLSVLLEETKGLSHYRIVEHFAGDGETMLSSACKAHLEGIVSKRSDAPYRSGRGDSWTKAKCRGGQEIVIGGWWGDARKLRSILIGAWRDKDFVYRGRIGTGFNATNSGPLLRALAKLRRPTSPFTAGVKPPRTKDIHWVEPKLVAEVEYATVTRDGLLRQASFKALREDKPARSVVLETATPSEVIEERAGEEAGKEKDMTRPAAREKKPATGDASVAGIAITHPEKALWPQHGKNPAVTKLDLAEYYEAAADRMLLHIAGRPISMVRAPDGIEGERFFQRHVLSGVKAVEPVKVEGEKNPYHSIVSVEGLVALAQAAVLEIHPWGSKKGDPETPERLVFDLDPDADLPFDRVTGAAREMRDLLQACGFTPFVKTTGGKGIHVVVAIEGTARKPATWADAKAFALAVAEHLTAASPDRYVSNMSKKQRAGKIFVDYLRNDRMATAIAPWSPRAREGATIAVPLPWSAVKNGLDPKAFSIASAKTFLKRADPWKDLAASAASLGKAMQKLSTL